MELTKLFGRLRNWVPVPTETRGIEPVRWILLEANRYAVVGALLTLTFGTIILVGTVWPLGMRRLLTETQAVQAILDTFLSGIILLVSIVVSINSIVLSYDITSISNQEERVEGTLDFRRELDRVADVDRSPTDPRSFLAVMATAIRRRAEALEEVGDGAHEEFAQDADEYVEGIIQTADDLERSLEKVGSAEFGVLWLGLETDYGPMINRSRNLASGHNDIPEDTEELMGELIDALELFSTGREYFKTLYYSREISELSRTLLVISLPAILVTASTILAINAGLLPDLWVFGLPPLLTFVAGTFTVALAPFIVLTAYMLRIATVAHHTSGAGPFGLQS